jgi:hypothetical protein
MEAERGRTQKVQSLMEKLRQQDAGKNVTRRIQSMQTFQEFTEFRLLAQIPFQ